MRLLAEFHMFISVYQNGRRHIVAKRVHDVILQIFGIIVSQVKPNVMWSLAEVPFIRSYD